ncbi:hypothetical protein FDZ73_21805, partial [bacterium]
RALDEAGKAYQDITDGIKEAETAFDRLLEQKLTVENKISAISTDISGQQKKIGEKESRLKVLEEMQHAYEGFHKGVREVLKSGKTGKLRGVCGVVAELVQVPEEYAVAVEVALGGAVQFIITETDGDAQQAIEFLKTGKAGRATFLPLNTIKSGSSDKSLEKIINTKDCLGTAADLVTIDDRFDNILRFLLGRIAVFKNLDQARKSARESGYRYKFVTLDGEIIHPGGSFTGGSSVRGSTGLLGRTTEIETLKKEILQQQEGLNKLRTDDIGLQGELAGIVDCININRAQTQENRLRLTAAGKDLEQRRTDQERISRLILSVNMDVDQENEELNRIRDKRKSFKIKLAELEKQNEDLQQKIGRLQDEIRFQQETREQINSLITASRVRVAALVQEAAGYEQLLARANSAVDDFKQQVKGKEEELALVDITDTGIAQEIFGLKEQIVKQLESRGLAEERLNLFRGERQSDAAFLTELENSCKQMQKQQGQFQELIHGLDVRRARMEIEV